jgi:hypothetical protein
MAGIKLDGAGAQKMKTIEEALATIQTLHGIVERMALSVKNKTGVGMFLGQVKRIAVPLQGQLKGQFGMIADQVAGMLIAMGRGGGEQGKVRVLREAVAQIRTALEMSQSKVKKDHAVEIEISPD